MDLLKPIDYSFLPFFIKDEDYAVDYVSTGYEGRNIINQRYRNTYLLLTVKNMKLFTLQKIFIGVCNIKSLDTVHELFPGDNFIECVWIDVDNPWLMILELAKKIQLIPYIQDSDIIYYSEDDQELYGKDLSNVIDDVIKNDNADMNYLVPHRLNDSVLDTTTIAIVNGRSFNTNNTYVEPVDKKYKTGGFEYYKGHNFVEAYSASFIVKFASFKKVNFRLIRNYWPTESMPHCLFFDLKCIKTLDIMRLFVVHIGGYVSELVENKLTQTILRLTDEHFVPLYENTYIVPWYVGLYEERVEQPVIHFDLNTFQNGGPIKSG